MRFGAACWLSVAAVLAVLLPRLAPAEEGRALGFVNEVVPASELMAAARRWADAILECAPLSVRATKEAVLEGLDKGCLEEAMQSHSAAVAAMIRSEDFVEGPRAFAQKRRPSWKGR